MKRIIPVLFLILVTLGLTTASLQAQPDMYSAPEKEWYTLTTKHFHVHYHEGAERTARVIAKIAEEIHGPLTALYNHEPDTRVSFIVKDFSDYSNGAAYFYNNKIEIWASPLDFELRGSHNWLRNVIAHEYTHIIQIQAAMKFGRRIPALTFQWFGYEKERRRDVLYGFPNTLVSYPFPGVVVPPWLAEGTAQFQRGSLGYETWDSHRDMILRSYVLADSMLTWGEMSAFGKTSLGNESVYNAGYNLTRYIAQNYGEDKLMELTTEMSKPFIFTVDAAIDNVLGRSGKELYSEWAAHLKSEYDMRIAPVLQEKLEGDLVGDIGFGNFHPAWSPNGMRFAYVSNKTSDYFGQSAIYMHDLESGEEKLIVPGVRSTLSWSPDGKRIAYSKYNDPSVYGHLFYDIYEYNLETQEERRVTKGLRAYNPSFSPDGEWIAFAYAKDGTVNVGKVDKDGNSFTNLTGFENGEQVFSPRWSPQGDWLVFGYAPRLQRGIARCRPNGKEFQVIIANPNHDCRDASFTHDGMGIIYASDKTGIFNIYRHDFGFEGEDPQLTNVTGGAFMPALQGESDLLYAAYTASGYKIARLADAVAREFPGSSYLPSRMYSSPIASTDPGEWDWEGLNSFDDAALPEHEPALHERLFQSMMYFPTIRVDQFNPDNEGIETLKPGVMLYSSDMLNRVEMMASGSINIKGERDLYFNITYRDKLPLFSSLGLYPDLSLEVFNVTRGTSSEIGISYDTVGVDVDFNLLAFSAKLGHNLFNNRMRLEFGYTHNRYTSTIGQFRNPATDNLVPATDNLYFVGNDLSAVFRYRDMVPTRDHEINPIGLRFSLYYDYEFNNFNPDGDYEVRNGLLVPIYTDFNFHRFDANLMFATQLPWWNHSLTVKLRGASILGDPVDDFFNYYAGGITGMQGYTYYALGGNELAAGQLTYRFPLIPNMDLRLGHILFDKLYGGVFFDIGDAVMEPDQFSVSGLKKDIGFELRLESYSFSMYPTRIFFSGAYGLDEFTRRFQFADVTYGKEWRWYFGMLFGFDLSDGF